MPSFAEQLKPIRNNVPYNHACAKVAFFHPLKMHFRENPKLQTIFYRVYNHFCF